MEREQMKTVTLAQQKGGVGKTTVCVNLACQAVAKGMKAAILDMDVEQGSATKWGERRSKAGLNGPVVLKVRSPDLERTLADLKAKGTDWVFIDLPGRNVPGTGMKNADLTIVPCRPLEDDIGPSLETVGLLRRGGSRYAYLMNIAPPQIDKARARKVGKVLEDAGHKVSPIIVVQRIGVPDANARGLSAQEHKPDSESAVEYSDLFNWIEGELK